MYQIMCFWNLICGEPVVSLLSKAPKPYLGTFVPFNLYISPPSKADIAHVSVLNMYVPGSVYAGAPTVNVVPPCPEKCTYN